MKVLIASILLVVPLSGCLCAMGGGQKGTSEPVKNSEGEETQPAEGDSADTTGQDNSDQDARADKNRQADANQSTKDCDLTVVAKSSGAVGDPCLTTSAFMQSEGMSEKAMAQVEKLVTELKERGGQPLAH